MKALQAGLTAAARACSHGEELLAAAVTSALVQGSRFDKEDFRKACLQLWQSDHTNAGVQTIIQCAPACLKAPFCAALPMASAELDARWMSPAM